MQMGWSLSAEVEWVALVVEEAVVAEVRGVGIAHVRRDYIGGLRSITFWRMGWCSAEKEGQQVEGPWKNSSS